MHPDHPVAGAGKAHVVSWGVAPPAMIGEGEGTTALISRLETVEIPGV